MAAPAGPLSQTERLALCASLAPDIAQVTAAFYAPEEPHPYLTSPGGGGILRRESVASDTEDFTNISVHGLPTSGLLTADILKRGSLPDGIPPDGVLWSVVTDRMVLPSSTNNTTVGSETSGALEHSWNYWDGKRWHTDRMVGSGKQAEWVSSTLLPDELVAMRALAMQTRGLHQIADVYGKGMEQFEEDMAAVEVDPETRKWLNIAFASAMTLRREIEVEGIEVRGFTNYFGTGYERVGQQTERIPLGGITPAYVSSVAQALANMYRGSAFIKKDSMRKRAYRARMKGRPLPLPATW